MTVCQLYQHELNAYRCSINVYTTKHYPVVFSHSVAIHELGQVTTDVHWYNAIIQILNTINKKQYYYKNNDLQKAFMCKKITIFITK